MFGEKNATNGILLVNTVIEEKVTSINSKIKNMKTWIIGDIHGEHGKLVELLKKINFDYENDTLIQLGDVVDRGPDSYKCVEELLKIKNLIAIKGNHDECYRCSIYSGGNDMIHHGAKQTLKSYQNEYPEFNNDPSNTPFKHVQFFENQKLYYVDKDNNFFVHAGLDRTELIENQSPFNFIWDRDLFDKAMSYRATKNKDFEFKNVNKFKTIFVGHTPTPYYQDKKGCDITIPIKAANVWNLDTGCGKGNYPLTAMNLETEEYFQSN